MPIWDKGLVFKLISLATGSISEIDPASSIIFCKIIKMLNATFHCKNKVLYIFNKIVFSCLYIAIQVSTASFPWVSQGDKM